MEYLVTEIYGIKFTVHKKDTHISKTLLNCNYWEKDLLDLYNGRYLEAIARLKNYAEGRNYSDSYREGLVRQRQT